MPRRLVTGHKDRQPSLQVIRTDVAVRLRARTAEIEKAVLSRVRSLSEPIGDEDPTYLAGVERAVAEALSYGLEGIEKGSMVLMPIPPETTRQARRAAREEVELDTVLRRYTAGNKSLEEFVVAEAGDVPSELLCQILSDQTPHVDRLLESVAAEYRDELGRTAQTQTASILHFLERDGLVGPTDVDYDFNVWHVGMILTGQGGEAALRSVAHQLGCRSLTVARDDETLWAWLGSVRKPDIAGLARLLDRHAQTGVSVALGEPRHGPDGWRRTLHEAQAALRVVIYRPQPVTRCRDVILDSAVMRDQRLAVALIETYLAPLDGRADSGEVLRKTLRAYFKADQNTASAALALGVARRTVERHLHRVEEKLGQTLTSCNAQLQVALSAEELVKVDGQVR